MGRLKIMSQIGEDIQLVWTTKEEAENVKRVFDEYIKKGYIAVVESQQTKKSKLIYSFDSSVEEIVMSPAVVGG